MKKSRNSDKLFPLYKHPTDARVQNLAHRVDQLQIFLHHPAGLGHMTGIPLDVHAVFLFFHLCYRADTPEVPAADDVSFFICLPSGNDPQQHAAQDPGLIDTAKLCIAAVG